MAHIRKLDANRWQARYRSPDGAEHARNFRRKADAERYLTTIEATKLRGSYRDPKAGTCSLDAFYAAEREKMAPALSPSTLEKYDTVWRLHVAPRLGSHPLNAITRNDVRAMVASVGNGSAWQSGESLKLVRLLLNRALDDDVIGQNPAARIHAPSPKRTPHRVLTREELDAIVAKLPQRWRAFVLLGAYGSLRWSELVAVRRDDLDLEARTVRIDEKVVEVRGRFEWGPPKTESSERVVDLPNLVIKPLAEHLLRFPPLTETDDEHHRGLVFYGERGGPVRRHVFRPVWETACAEAKIEPIRLEWLRHTGASIAYRATKDMKAVANRLGHTSVRMLDTTYVKVYSDAAREVADAIDGAVPRTSRGFSADSLGAV
jgi:integrase